MGDGDFLYPFGPLFLDKTARQMGHRLRKAANLGNRRIQPVNQSGDRLMSNEAERLQRRARQAPKTAHRPLSRLQF